MSVSSEAKRTLVKSPPELWAELSDPDSLSRHLGELGDVRIVRIDPERAVEWEAAEISGTVLIEPSGWGTKVTLTAIRAQAESAPSPENELAQAAEPESPQPETEPIEASDPAPESPVAQTPDVGSAQALAPATAAAQVSTAVPADAPSPEPEPSPPADALASDPEDAVPSEPLDQEPHLDEPAPFAPEDELAIDVEPLIHDEPAAAAEPEPTPRRGFLARLFGRRRNQPVVEPRLAEHPPEPDSAYEPDEGLAGEETLEDGDAFGAVAEVEAVDADEAVEQVAVIEATIEAAEGADMNPTDGDRSDSARTPPYDWQPLVEPEDGEASPDLSTELAELEERTTAVLVGVLDRLGAAHHRPFSRG